MFRPDKKLKRKQAWKRWRKTRNILENWRKEDTNRVKAGLPRRGPPVHPTRRRKYPPTKMQIKLAKRIEKAKKAWQLKKAVAKLKWYKRLWLKIINLLKKIKKK